MPRTITAATGMDALTHAIEAYVNRWPHAETAFHCRAAVRMIFANLPRACADGGDVAAREAMALASFYAGLAFTKAYVGYVHAFSHKIGGMYGVPHGLANAITLPYVLDFLQDSRRSRGAASPISRSRSARVSKPSQRMRSRSASSIGCAISIAASAFRRTIAALKPSDVPGIARAAMIEAHRDYPVPKNMTLVQAEATLRHLQPTAS